MSHTELVAYIKISVPFMSRDTALHAYGVDCLIEKGMILLIGNSIDSLEGHRLPHVTMNILREQKIIYFLKINKHSIFSRNRYPGSTIS